ncbi:isopentenyl-diphosphate Delta-isomerase [Pedobacter changchengzhani]|uniref:Isopentenyl-diphosphate delta-isomerase n=1 Tax=Pedobacter changchengzhani TaxID=2529274 RepID=A0A4R5MM44_9SPHI|nr:isopentenyl-diphosphate Delta-isomerase [Pedobacter changchengzhani]TDG36189.1 isopentenyl-diphosphate Delta-isomerase [Pedobacter changchengzhani]
MVEEEVIIVNEKDEPIGTMPKMSAHLEGKLHRAFSVFIFNSKGELLLQQRALDKYHSPGKWTNSCCSHPRPGELNTEAANRRLKEEMDLVADLKPIFSFSYFAKFDNGLIENEYDHVFFGLSDDLPNINTQEVASFKYINMEDLKNDLIIHEHNYTPWLKICFDEVMVNYKKLNF